MREIRLSGSMRGGELFVRSRDEQLPAYSTKNKISSWFRLRRVQELTSPIRAHRFGSNGR